MFKIKRASLEDILQKKKQGKIHILPVLFVLFFDQCQCFFKVTCANIINKV